MRYSSAVQAVLAAARPQELGPGTPNKAVYPLLKSLTPENAFEHPVSNPDLAAASLAGLWLLHNFLDEAHRLSQDLDTPEGSYWHGLVHRREPDFNNAKFWFRRVHRHPVFEPLRNEAADFARMEPGDGVAFMTSQASWDAERFVDLCESVALGNKTLEHFCSKVQQAEWQLLFDYCYRGATGE